MLSIGFETGVIYLIKLDENKETKPLKIDNVHSGRKITEMIWSSYGDKLFVGDDCGHVILNIINWSSRITHYKYLCIDGLPIVKIIIDEEDETLYYITNYSFVSLDLSDLNKIQRKVFNFDDDNEDLEYRGLIHLEFNKTNTLNGVSVIDKEGFVSTFEIESRKKIRQYSLEGCENIESTYFIENDGLVLRENKCLRYFISEEIDGQKTLFLKSVWDVDDLVEEESNNSYNSYDDEDNCSIIDVCYYKNKKILFALIDPKDLIIFSDDNDNQLFKILTNTDEPMKYNLNKSDFQLTFDIFNYTTSTTKEFIDKKMPGALAKIDKIKTLASETVLEKLEESKEVKLPEFTELPDTSLKFVYPFEFFKEKEFSSNKLRDICITKKSLKFKKRNKYFIKNILSAWESDVMPEKEEITNNLLEVSDIILTNSRPLKPKYHKTFCESSIPIRTNYEYELENQLLNREKSQSKDKSLIPYEIPNRLDVTSITISPIKIKPFSTFEISNENEYKKVIFEKKNVQEYIDFSHETFSWAYFFLPYITNSFAISSKFLITTALEEWTCNYIEFENDNVWKNCVNYPGDIVKTNEDGTLLWKITKGKAFSPKEDIISNLDEIFGKNGEWKSQTPNDYVIDASFRGNDCWYLTKQGPFVIMNLPSMGILFHAPFKKNTKQIFNKIAASDNGVWILSTECNVIYGRGGLDKCQMGIEWIKIKSIKRLPYDIVSISLHATNAFALDSSFNIWMLPEVSKKNVIGSKKGWYKLCFGCDIPKSLKYSNEIEVSSNGIFIRSGNKIFHTSSGYVATHKFILLEKDITFYNFKRISNLSWNDIYLFHRNGDCYIFNVLEKKYKILGLDFLQLNSGEIINEERKIMINDNYIFLLDLYGILWVHKRLIFPSSGYLDKWSIFNDIDKLKRKKLVIDFTLTNDYLFILSNDNYIFKYDLLKKESFCFPKLPDEVIFNKIFVSRNTSIIWVGDTKKFIYFSYSLKNNIWMKICNNSCDELISKIVLGDNIVWGISNKLESLYYLKKFNEKTNPRGNEWCKVIDTKIIDIALNFDDGNELIILDKKGILKKHDIISIHFNRPESLNFPLTSTNLITYDDNDIPSSSISTSTSTKFSFNGESSKSCNDTFYPTIINTLFQNVPELARKKISGVASKIFNH
uniref:WD_REPEATS_REGION domain-containing protein n=1 Tax=Parastrongyloides trichosuri TaxID=131310 RepID=A0A0N4Z0W7_PARTI